MGFTVIVEMSEIHFLYFLLVLEISETMSKVPSNTGLHNYR